MKIKDLMEITGGSVFPDYDDKTVEKVVEYLLNNHTIVRQIKNDAWLCIDNKRQTYFIITQHQDQKHIVGWIMVSPKKIQNQMYQHVDMCYILPQYRGSSAGEWLFYAVKQYSKYPMIADNAISSQAEAILAKGLKSHYNKIHILNKDTGVKRPVDNLIVHSDNECYLFERHQMQLGYNLLPGSDKLDTFYMVFESF